MDEDFEHYYAQFQEFQTLTESLKDATSKYQAAIKNILEHQHKFAEVLIDVCRPIEGGTFRNNKRNSTGSWSHFSGKRKQSSTSSLNRNSKFGKTAIEFDDSDYDDYAPQFDEDQSRLSSELSSMSLSLEVDDKMKKKIDQFIASTSRLNSSILPELDTRIERQCCSPIQDLASLHKKVQKIAVKRNHKLLDYERRLDALNKLKEKVAKDQVMSSEERKIMKAENALDVAYQEYSKVNDYLKLNLPSYIDARIPFIDPIMLNLIEFQLELFHSMVSEYTFLEEGDQMEDFDQAYERKHSVVQNKVNSISLLSCQDLNGKNEAETVVSSPRSTDLPQAYAPDSPTTSISASKPRPPPPPRPPGLADRQRQSLSESRSGITRQNSGPGSSSQARRPPPPPPPRRNR